MVIYVILIAEPASSSKQHPARFRLARESSQQLKKALAETEAAHFVRGPWGPVATRRDGDGGCGHSVYINIHHI